MWNCSKRMLFFRKMVKILKNSVQMLEHFHIFDVYYSNIQGVLELRYQTQKGDSLNNFDTKSSYKHRYGNASFSRYRVSKLREKQLFLMNILITLQSMILKFRSNIWGREYLYTGKTTTFLSQIFLSCLALFLS